MSERTNSVPVFNERALLELIKAAVREVLDERQLVVSTDELTKDQVAKLLGVCTRSVTTYMKREGIPHRLRGGRPAFKREAVLEWWRDRGRSVPVLRSMGDDSNV